MNQDVTVVIPILNESHSLPALLAGLKAQTLRPKELIIVDAGSTDGSAALVESWWRREQWEGAECRVLSVPGALPGAGRNAGVREARHEWIAFIDGGIAPQSDWLEQLWGHATRRQSPAVFGVCQFLAEGVFARAVCALSYGQGSFHSVVPASLFHRQVFDAIGFFPEQFRSAEDLAWSQRVVNHFGAREICKDAVVRYTHFPLTWRSASRKWRLSEYCSVLAGVRSRQHLLYLAGLPLLYGLLFSGTMVGVGLFWGYLLVRGGCDPVRRSRERPWWGRRPEALIVALGLAPVLDLAKFFGIVHGLVVRMFGISQGSRPVPVKSRSGG